MKQYGKSWYETFMEDLHTLGVAVTRVSPNEMYKQPAKEEAMKVQLRVKSTSCTEWEVVDEAKAFYIVKDHAGFLRVLDKADYEPVEEWVPLYSTYFDTTGYDLRVADTGGRLTIEGKRKR